MRNDHAVLRVNVPRVLYRLKRLDFFGGDRLGVVGGVLIDTINHLVFSEHALALTHSCHMLVQGIPFQVFCLRKLAFGAVEKSL